MSREPARGVRFAEARCGALRCGAVVAVLVVLTTVSSLASGASAASQAGPVTVTAGEKSLTVSADRELDPAGAKVAINGSGYDQEKGIYVAFCVVPPAGQLPTPCGGGADMSGSMGGSAWVSSHPPAYGKNLATPYEDGGSFALELTLSPMIGEIDCRTVACAVVTRADHTRTDDRSQDVLVPVAFVGGSVGPGTAGDDSSSAVMPAGLAGLAGLAGIVVLVAVGGGIWFALRRRRDPAVTAS